MRRDYRTNQVDKKQNSCEAEEKNNQIIQLLAETWPNCFSWFGKFRRPLKVGIFEEIVAAMNGAVTPDELSEALKHCCGSEPYLLALSGLRTRGIPKRIDLDGNPAGIVTPTQSHSALCELMTAARSGRRLPGSGVRGWDRPYYGRVLP